MSALSRVRLLKSKVWQSTCTSEKSMNLFSLKLAAQSRTVCSAIHRKTPLVTKFNNDYQSFVKNYSTHESTAEDPSSSDNMSSKFEFQAETAELLNIVAKSLYSENEVFVREVISNASDALEKLRYSRLTSEIVTDTETPLEIHLETDRYSNTLTIRDTGIGMSYEDLIKNLGTIARSGSKEFMKTLSAEGTDNSSIIGQFGVGFYSTFMVANKVEVFSKNYLPESKGYCWSSEGDLNYEISENESVEPGTKIVLTLKPECRKYTEEDTIKEIIKKHSSFVGFPVYLNGNLLNSVEAIWTKDASQIDEDEHLKFFRHLSGNEHEHYMYKLFYKTDAPLSIRSILYMPEQQPTLLEMTQNTSGETGVSLYCRKVLIQSKAEHILPKWLRFLRGVVDSEDIPLNLSRELLQNSSLIRKIRETLTSRVVRFFLQQSKRDPEKYLSFHSKFKLFITEGVLSEEEQDKKEEAAQLLRYESSSLPKGECTSLKDYISRMKEDQKTIYYLCAPSRQLAESSPYIESLRGKDVEVLFCYDPYDEVTMLQLRSFQEKSLFSVENEIAAEMFKPEESKDAIENDGEVKLGLSKSQSDSLIEWSKATLDKKVMDVKVTDKLDQHPAMITVWEMGSVRHFLKSQHLTDSKAMSEEEKLALFKPVLQLNSNHIVVSKLLKLSTENEDLAKLLLETVYDNAMISAGLTEDARPMVGRMNSLLSKILESQ